MIFVGSLAAHYILAGFPGSGGPDLGNEYTALATATLTVAAVFLGAVGLIFFAKQRSPNGSSNSRSQLQQTAPAPKPLTSEDFPVSAEGDKLVTQEGNRIAETDSKFLAEDIAGRLNEDETRRR